MVIILVGGGGKERCKEERQRVPLSHPCQPDAHTPSQPDIPHNQAPRHPTQAPTLHTHTAHPSMCPAPLPQTRR